MGHGVAGGVVAGGDEEGEEVVELLIGEEFPVGHRGEKLAYDVVARAGPPIGGLFLGVGEDLYRGRAPERHEPVVVGVGQVDDGVGEVGVGVAEQGVAPRNQPVAVFVAGAEQPPEHPHRELFGHLVYEVELALGERLLDHVDRELADLVFVAFHRSPGETLADEAPISGVFRRIELHHRAPGRQARPAPSLRAVSPSST